MGDANSVLTPGETRHLLRRTGFGVDPRLVTILTRREFTRGRAVDWLLRFRGGRFLLRGRNIRDVHNRWIRVMTRTRRPLMEKLTLFWHDHFATSNETVADHWMMGMQNRLMRMHSNGNFKTLVREMNTDLAMMDFLDTVRNHKSEPNENYARELMELFTLGVTDLNGVENYTQGDIVQIARAFSGWGWERKARRYFPTFRTWRHDFMEDYPERGPKVIFTTVGGFGSGGRDFTSNGEGEAEIDTVTDILFEHRDSDGQNTVARHVTHKLFTFFAHDNPSKALVDELIATSGFDQTFELTPLLRAMFVHDEFYASGAPAPWLADTPKSVRWPIDYVVSSLRQLRMVLHGRDQFTSGGSHQDVRSQLTNMGQTLLEPPSVFGWDWEQAWLNSATLLARYQFARDLVASRDARGRRRFVPRRLMDLDLTDPGAIVDAVTEVFQITDQITPTERDVFIDYLTDGGLQPTLDLHDENIVNTKLHGLFALVMQSPAYQLH